MHLMLSIMILLPLKEKIFEAGKENNLNLMMKSQTKSQLSLKLELKKKHLFYRQDRSADYPTAKTKRKSTKDKNEEEKWSFNKWRNINWLKLREDKGASLQLFNRLQSKRKKFSTKSGEHGKTSTLSSRTKQFRLKRYIKRKKQETSMLSSKKISFWRHTESSTRKKLMNLFLKWLSLSEFTKQDPEREYTLNAKKWSWKCLKLQKRCILVLNNATPNFWIKTNFNLNLWSSSLKLLIMKRVHWNLNIILKDHMNGIFKLHVQKKKLAQIQKMITLFQMKP